MKTLLWLAMVLATVSPTLFADPDFRGHRGRDEMHNRTMPPRERVFIAPARARVVPSHQPIATSHAIARDIRSHAHVEVVPNRYYWHNAGGVRYAHYYWRGHHWYGFYAGPRFYWTRWHGNHWWWWDVGFNRWVFWSNGYWWWPAPGGVLYVDVNDVYYPYDQAPITVERPEIPSSPTEVATPSAKDSSAVDATWKSPDGLRMAQLVGPESTVFLYDTSNGSPRFMTTLGKNAERVRFSGGTGDTQQILVDFKDGHYALFRADGSPWDNAQSSAAAAPVDTNDNPEIPPAPPDAAP